MTTAQVRTHQNYIGGQWVDSSSEDTYAITNPASKSSVLGRFQVSTPEDALDAVAAAGGALPGWANTPAPARARFI